MNKDWLVRTGQNKILGPVSREKLLELVEKGSLSDSDEICHGNGYWIYLREEELIEKYLIESVHQPFNPISECKTVLCRKSDDIGESDDAETNNTLVIGQDVLSQLKDGGSESDDGPVLPDSDDLEFPDIDLASPPAPTLDSFESDDSFDESTLPSVADLQDLEVDNAVEVAELPPVEDTPDFDAPDEEVQGKVPSDEDLEYPDLDGSIAFDDTGEIEISLDEINEEIEVEQEIEIVEDVEAPAPPKKLPKKVNSNEKVTKNSAKKTRPVESKVAGNDRYLFFIFFIMVALVAYAVYFYYAKIANFRSNNKGYLDELSSLIMPSAYAQQITELPKKKKY